jgi:twitching motility protein PilT
MEIEVLSAIDIKFSVDKILQKIFNEFANDNESSDLHLRSNDYPILRTKNTIVRLSTEFEKITKGRMIEFVRNLFQIRYGEDIGTNKFNNFALSNAEYDMAIMLPESSYRCRVNIFKSLSNFGVVLRKIPSKMPNLEKLNFYPEHVRKIKDMIERKEGLILVTGQTGSGKSTTLASIIDYINHTSSKHIITIEDPVEFMHTSNKSVITHREVGDSSDTASFEKGLISSLREDPDIILVGEIRDAETAMAAIQASQTGHIVFATLHTNSAPETILRIIDMFPATKEKSIKTSLASSLKMIISQKLAPSVTNGRILLYEILINTNSVQNLIVKEDFNEVTIIDQMRANMSNEHSMIPLNYCIVKRMNENDDVIRIDKKTAYEFSNDRGTLEQLINKKSEPGINIGGGNTTPPPPGKYKGMFDD